MAKGKKDSFQEFAVGLTKGVWFNVLEQGQKIEGTLTRVFDIDSKLKNNREDSPHRGKKRRTAYEVSRVGKPPIIFTERGGGAFQEFFDALAVGDEVIVHYKGLEREGDNALCPSSVKTFEQLKKWKGGKGVRTFPIFTRLARRKGPGHSK